MLHTDTVCLILCFLLEIINKTPSAISSALQDCDAALSLSDLQSLHRHTNIVSEYLSSGFVFLHTLVKEYAAFLNVTLINNKHPYCIIVPQSHQSLSIVQEKIAQTWINENANGFIYRDGISLIDSYLSLSLAGRR